MFADAAAADCEAKLAANAKQPSTDERRRKLRAEKLRTLRDAMPRVKAFEGKIFGRSCEEVRA